MSAKPLSWLAVLLFLTGIGLVQTRHEHRLAYARLQAQEIEHDQLVDQWRQLLTEENLWGFPHRIEKDATDALSMKKPESDDVIYLDLSRPDASSSALASSQEAP